MILPLNATTSALSSAQGALASSGGTGFADAIGAAISQVESAQKSAKTAANELLIGGKCGSKGGTVSRTFPAGSQQVRFGLSGNHANADVNAGRHTID
jgi:hypothetical protein